MAAPVRGTLGGTRGPTGNEMDWKNGEGEIIVMKLARLPLSAFMGVLPEGRSRCALFHRADCYWLIDVDRFFSPRDVFACGIRLYERRMRDIAFELVLDRARSEDQRQKVMSVRFHFSARSCLVEYWMNETDCKWYAQLKIR